MLAGIDLGGTQVRVALARSDGNLVTSVKTKTPLLKTPQGLVDWAAAEIERLRGNQKVTSIAIGAPGPIDIKHGVLVNPPNLPWKNVPLAKMLNRATGAKVHLANDADMAGLGEFHRGAGRGTRNMVYITWSTGVGGGLIIDGRLHRGGHGTAGEIGHMIIDPEMFVLGGGVTRSWKLVAPTMLETLRSSPFIKPARRPKVRRARLGDRAGQVGAVEWARINQ